MDSRSELGVGDEADDADIKRAYRRRVEETHPDLNSSGSMEEFERVQHAYEQLMRGQTLPLEPRRLGGEPAPEEDELHERLKMDWELYRTPKDEYYVAHPDGDAFVGPRGGLHAEPYYYPEYVEAKSGFARYLKQFGESLSTLAGRSHEPVGVRWGSTDVVERLDGFWDLAHQRSLPDGEEDRWAVFCRDKRLYLTAEGRRTGERTWLDSEAEALEAYDRYQRRADRVRLPLRLALTLPYLVFVLPLKLVERLLFAEGRLLAWFGGAESRTVPFGAEVLVVASIVALAYFVEPALGVLAAVQFGVVLLYWVSPLEPEGRTLLPRWSRRRRAREGHEV